jgi:hypothetical protein
MNHLRAAQMMEKAGRLFLTGEYKEALHASAEALGLYRAAQDAQGGRHGRREHRRLQLPPRQLPADRPLRQIQHAHLPEHRRQGRDESRGLN